MEYSRRGFSKLLPALAAGTAVAQQGTSKRLPTKIMKFEDLPLKVNGPNKSYAVLEGETHTGSPVEVHVTNLAAGQSPHGPHRHAHEEMFMLQAGLLDVTVNGVTKRLTAGSVLYVNSGEEHGVHNPGPDHSQYFVVALGEK